MLRGGLVLGLVAMGQGQQQYNSCHHPFVARCREHLILEGAAAHTSCQGQLHTGDVHGSDWGKALVELGSWTRARSCCQGCRRALQHWCLMLVGKKRRGSSRPPAGPQSR